MGRQKGRKSDREVNGMIEISIDRQKDRKIGKQVDKRKE